MNASRLPESVLRARGPRDSIAAQRIAFGLSADRAAETRRVAMLDTAHAAEEAVDANAVGTHIAESRTAGLIADDTYRSPGARLPSGWSRVRSNLGDDLKAAGAEYLQSPTGMKYIAFSKAAAENDVKGRLADSIGVATTSAVAANSIGKRLFDVQDVTYTGAGRGGAIAKLAAESASYGKDDDGNVRHTQPKLCVPINAQSVSPRIYESFGLSAKTHSRNTLNVEYKSDAKDRLEIKLAVRRDGNAWNRKTIQDQQIVRDGTRSHVRGAAPPDPSKKTYSGAEVSKARQNLQKKDLRTPADPKLKISQSLIAQDDRIGEKAVRASSSFTAAVVSARLGQAVAPMRMRNNEHAYAQALGAADRGR